MDLTRKTALVTGSNRGIGRAIAEALAKRSRSTCCSAACAPPDKFEPLEPPPGGAREVRPVRSTSARARNRSSGAAADAAGDRPAREQRRPHDRRPARGAGRGRRSTRCSRSTWSAVVASHQAGAARDARARPRQDRQQRQHLRLRLVPRGQHLRGGEDGRRRLQRVAAARAQGHRRERAPPRHAGRQHGHAGRHPGGLRPPHGHERLDRAGARGVGAQGRARDRATTITCWARAASSRSPSWPRAARRAAGRCLGPHVQRASPR